MEIVSSTLPALVIAAIFAILGPTRGLWLFFAVMPMGATAAFNLPAVGGATITVSDLTIVVLFAMMVLRRNGMADMAGTMRFGQPGFWLLLFFGYAVIATLFFPRIFEGKTDVFGIGRIANAVGIVIRPLHPDGGNISQLFRMALSLMAFFALAALYRRSGTLAQIFRALAWATGVHVALGVLDVLSFSGGFTWIMEPFRTANYTLAFTHDIAGVKRMVGGFPEASAFGYLTLGLFGFWARYWVGAQHDRAANVFFALSAFVLIRSTSSSAYVAGGAFLLVMAGAGLLRHRSETVSRRIGASLAITGAILPVLLFSLVMLYEVSSEFQKMADRLLLDKMSTDSGVERMSWNVQALRNFWDTWMLGAGLGSVRASNWLVASLATTGLIGTLTLAAFVVSVLRLAAPASGNVQQAGLRLMIVSLQAGCLGLLLRGMVVKSSPNLDVYFFAMAGLAAGLSRAAFPRQQSAPLPVFQSVRGTTTGFS